MDKDRLIAFTDTILAIIMTILVLELKEPETLSYKVVGAERQLFAYIFPSWLGTCGSACTMNGRTLKDIHTGHLVQPVHPLLLIALSLCDEDVSNHFDDSFAQGCMASL